MKGELAMEFQHEEAEQILLEESVISDVERSLIVLNDDVNTFDHVIDTLIKICKHTKIQAEQCTYIIHYNGKCSVKKGAFDKLKPMHEGILDAGIGAIIV